MSPDSLEKTARSLGIPAGDFRFLGRRGTSEAVLQIFRHIETHFGNHITALWWSAQSQNSFPQYALDYRNGDAIDAIQRIVPDKRETVWLTTRHIPEQVVPDHRNPGHDINLFEAPIADICDIINNSYGFDFFLISQSFKWLIHEDDHGILRVVGQPVVQRLQALGPPTSHSAG